MFLGFCAFIFVISFYLMLQARHRSKRTALLRAFNSVDAPVPTGMSTAHSSLRATSTPAVPADSKVEDILGQMMTGNRPVGKMELDGVSSSRPRKTRFYMKGGSNVLTEKK